MIEKWIAIIVVLSSLVIIEDLVKDSQKKYFGIAVFAITWFLTAFRYEIGWDYDSYKRNFFIVDFDNIEIEPGYILIAMILRNLGFDYQMIFVIFATITYAMLWKTISYYKCNNHYINYGLAAYLFFAGPVIGYSGLTVLRQTCAVVIFFYGTRYIIEQNLFKYCISLLLACLFHYTAILLIPLYFIVCRRYKVYEYIGIFILSIIIYKFDLVTKLIELILPFDSKYLAYMQVDESGSLGITFLFYILLIIIALIFKSKNQLSLNMIFISVIFMVIFVNNQPLLRMRLYSFVFIVIFYQDVIHCANKIMKKKLLALFMIPIVVLFLYDWNVRDYNKNYDSLVFPYQSAGNIDYKFNFNLFKE